MKRRDFITYLLALFGSSVHGESFSLNKIRKENLYKTSNLMKSRARSFIKHTIPSIIIRDLEAQQSLINIAKPLFKTSNRKLNWKIFLVYDSNLAYTIGEGVIIIDIGLLKLCSTQTELASVIAHEIGHNHYKHLEKRYMTKRIFKELDFEHLNRTNVDILAKAFSKNNEREADAFIIKAFLKTNYNINEASSFFRRLTKIYPDNISINHCLHSTHPLKRDRIKILDKVVSTYSQSHYNENNSSEFKYLKFLSKDYDA